METKLWPFAWESVTPYKAVFWGSLLVLSYHPILWAKPVPKLEKGATVAIVAPSKPADQSTLHHCIQNLIRRGYKVKLASNLSSKRGYLAGTDKERATAFMEAWNDDDVKAVWAYAGGFGSTRILEYLNFDEIKRHPKILIGMSDITALHLAIGKTCDFPTFLGPNCDFLFGKRESSPDPYSEESLFRAIQQTQNLQYHSKEGPSLSLRKIIRSGHARGQIVGGNLSLIAALVGTPWQIQTEGKILLLEDVSEEPFRIDRMLQQLKQAGLLDSCSGVILSSWVNCSSKTPGRSLTLMTIFEDYFSHAPYPVLLGFPSGHISQQATIPLGVNAELDTTRLRLKITEPVVK